MSNTQKYVIAGVLVVGAVLVVFYIVLRNSKKSPISNTPVTTQTSVTHTKGLDFAGIGSGIGSLLNPMGSGMGSLFNPLKK